MFRAATRYAPALRSRFENKPISIVGPSGQGERSQIGSQRSINWYPVKPEREGDLWTLRGTPGIALLDTLPRTPIRGVHVHLGRMFAVAGARLYEVYADGSYKEWGKIPSVRGKVTMASLLSVIVVGDGSGYFALDLDAGTVAKITDAPRGRFCVFFNQRIIFQGENGQIFYSELNDPTNVPGLNFFSAESLPDEVVAITTTEDQLWLHGEESTEVWYDSGDVDNPFQRIQGGVIYNGCAFADTALRVDNSIWQVGSDKEGAGIVWRSNGFNFMRVSTSPVERFLKTATNVSAYSYQEDGHTFYVVNANQGTWAFDLKAQEWHERAWLNRNGGEQERQRQEFHAYAYGQHMVCDYKTGAIYRMGLDLFDDAGQEVRRTRITSATSFGGRSIIMDELWLDFATGVGLDGSARDPVAMLRVSTDGSTFGSEATAPLGAIGDFDAQVRFFGLGLGRDWLFEISVSDPVITGLMGAEAKLRVGRR